MIVITTATTTTIITIITSIAITKPINKRGKCLAIIIKSFLSDSVSPIFTLGRSTFTHREFLTLTDLFPHSRLNSHAHNSISIFTPSFFSYWNYVI